MSRSPNHTTERAAPGVVIQFKPHEFGWLKRNTPGPSGQLGGYQRFENKLIDLTDRATLRCPLAPADLERMIRYAQKYGTGGPNQRIRDACIPALRRAGIELVT